MKIGFVVHSFAEGYGGPFTVVRDLAAELATLGHDVRIVCGDIASMSGARVSNEEKVALQQWACAHQIDLFRIPFLFHYHWASFPRFPSQLQEALSDRDIVHICAYRDGYGWVAARFAQRNKIPYIWEPMGMLKSVGRSGFIKGMFDSLLGRSTVLGASSVVCTGPIEQKEHMDVGVADDQSVMRFNGLAAIPEIYDLAEAKSARRWKLDARTRLGLDSDTKLFVYLGRLAARKGLDRIAKALRNIDGELILVGPDDGEGVPDQIASILGNRACCVGSVSGEEKWSWLAAADAFVLGSPFGENFAISALEASAVGTPVALSDQVGYGNVMDPRCGLILPKDETQWSAVLAKEFDVLSNDLVKQVRHSFAWSVLAQQQVDLYKRALQYDREKR